MPVNSATRTALHACPASARPVGLALRERGGARTLSRLPGTVEVDPVAAPVSFVNRRGERATGAM